MKWAILTGNIDNFSIPSIFYTGGLGNCLSRNKVRPSNVIIFNLPKKKRISLLAIKNRLVLLLKQLRQQKNI